jgi:hypothetical protein
MCSVGSENKMKINVYRTVHPIKRRQIFFGWTSILILLIEIDIGQNRRTQQKLFMISYTILLFDIQCN